MGWLVEKFSRLTQIARNTAPIVHSTTDIRTKNNMRFINRKTLAIAGAAVALVALGSTGTAVAGGLIGSSDIQDDSIRSVDIKDGKVKYADMSLKLQKMLAQHATNGKNGTDVDPAVLQDLRDRIHALEGTDATGHDINTNWVVGEDGGPATIVDANTVRLDSADQGYSYASIKNLDLQAEASTVIEYTYRLSDGAVAAAGAPRLKIVIGGVSYSSVHQINPNYGTQNPDGSFTVSVVATSLNNNSANQNPNGSITRSSLIYEGTGSIEFTNVKIDGQQISFK